MAVYRPYVRGARVETSRNTEVRAEPLESEDTAITEFCVARQ